MTADITTLCAMIIAAATVVAIPIQMIRHLRADLEDKLVSGEKKFETIIKNLEKCSESMAVVHADYAAVNAKLTMLINENRGK